MDIFLWSEAMLLADCLKSNNQYPKIIKFCEGYYGGSESLTIEISDTIVVASAFSLKRVMGINSKKTILTLPIRSPLKFYIKGNGYSQRLSAIFNKEYFPFTIDVDENCLSKEDISLQKYLTGLKVMCEKTESYFCGYNSYRGQLSEQQLILPFNMNMTVKVANGLYGATHKEWEGFLKTTKIVLLEKPFFKIEKYYDLWIYSAMANVHTGMPDHIFPLLQDKNENIYIDIQNINTLTASASPVIHLKSILAEKDLEVGSQHVKENNTKPKSKPNPIDIKIRAPMPLPRKTPPKSTIGIVEDSPPTVPPRTYRLSDTRELQKKYVSLPRYF